LNDNFDNVPSSDEEIKNPKAILSKKTIIIATSIIVVVLLAVLIIFGTTSSEKPLTVHELLEVAERYLLDRNYEQALVEFIRVIEVDPLEPRGYTGAADAYVGQGRIDDAIAILERGLEVLPGNAEIITMLDSLRPEEEKAEHEPEDEDEIEDEYESLFDRLANKLIELYLSSGYEAVIVEMHSASLKNKINILFANLGKESLIYNKRVDIGCGLYKINEDIFVYIGDYDDLNRSGNGIWLWVDTDSNSHYIYTGSWTNNLPNGDGKTVRVNDESKIERREGHTYALVVTMVGTFVDGLYDGPFNIKWLMCNGHTHNWDVTAEDGIFIVIDSQEWNDSILGYCTECEASKGGNDNIVSVMGF